MVKTYHEDKNVPLICVKGIYKSFGQNNKVLKGIDLKVHAGEVISLIGGNGAGKSTLMKIIMGIMQPDQGEIEIRGEKVALTKPSIALSHGIYMVPQEPMLFPNMTVEENVTIGFNEKSSELRKRLVNLMDEIGWKIDLSRKAGGLSIAEQQLVEILRGLLRNAKLLILDEPTSALTFDEVKSLFKCVTDLKAKGIGIIYITHRLAEVFEISTHVSILRDGIVTLNGPIENFTREMLVKGLLPPDMDNQSVKEWAQKRRIDYDKLEPVFKLVDYSGYGFHKINLEVYPGEILGVAGVVGGGRTEIASTIFGRDKVLGGKVILDGKDITGLDTRKVIDSGVNYVSEDRHLHGMFKISDITSNTTSAILCDSKMGKCFLNRKFEKNETEDYIKKFRIKVTGQEQLAGSLSGGNQQKIVLARSLTTKPKLVILDEPTRGIDAAARADVYKIIEHLRDEGVAVMLISSDMEEVIELSDRAVTVFQGRINAEFKSDEINQDNLMAAAFGIVDEKRVD